jgi:hypothetical protein
MITHELNHEEIASLLQEQKYSLSEIQDHLDHSVVISREDSVYAYIFTVPSEVVVIAKRDYTFLLDGAKGIELTPMMIVGTPVGIYEFNLELLDLKWERYDSDDGSFDDEVAEIKLSSGIRILEWYPDFSSEEEYLDSLMGDAEPSQWDEGDEW